MFAGAFFGGSGTIAFSAYVLGVLSIIISHHAQEVQDLHRRPGLFVGGAAELSRSDCRQRIPLHVERGSSFIKKAGTAILLSTIFAWFTSATAENGVFCAVTDIDNSIMARIGSVIASDLYAAGLRYLKSTVAAISGLVAKENVVATFGQLYHFAGEVI